MALNAAVLRVLLTVLAVVGFVGEPPRAVGEEELWAYRNLGKAFYENPTTKAEAVEQFRKALEIRPGSSRERLNFGLALLRAGRIEEGITELERVQRDDPSLPHTWFNLGIQYKARGRDLAASASAEEQQRGRLYTAKAIAQLERMIALDPREAVSHHNLGLLYKEVGRLQDALTRFEHAARLNPQLAGPHWQLEKLYKAPEFGRPDDAARELAAFQRIKREQAGAVIPEDLEWSYYSEIYDPVDAADEPADPKPATPAFRVREVLRDLDAASAGLVTLDADADHRPDLLVWSARGAQLVVAGETVSAAGLDELSGLLSIAPGDFDNDGAPDLAVLTRTGASLWRNAGGRSFVSQPLPLSAGRFSRALWLDYDHDYDLDLLLFGPASHLLRNGGAAGFTDVTPEFPFQEGTPVDATNFEAVADTTGHDVVVSYADRPGVLYRDRLAGKYEAATVEALPAGARSLLALDLNRDSWMDLAAATGTGAIVLLNRPTGLASLPVASTAGAGLASGDFENRGVADLVAGNRVVRWTTGGWLDAPLDDGDATARAIADFDGDGLSDLASITRDGTLRIGINTTGSGHRWLRVALTGVKNVKSAVAARVEVKAGARYQKALYQGVPLLFGLGDRERVDTVRITWPNGLIQNEMRQAASHTAIFKEAPRLSGSCPMIFTWDGSRFRFVTDVLGVAPLGASAGDGEYFPVDHDEYVLVAGDSLAPAGGQYEVRVTEELREVSYLDRIQLIALDYPASLTIVTNDKFKGPPFPEFRLFGIQNVISPIAARDHRGTDVLDRLTAVDRHYPDGYRRDFEAVAEQHHLDLDFGRAAPDNRAVLVLTGWVDWADGSTFRGASQEQPAGLILPYLQVKDAEGRWKTVIEDMGIPAGKTKTIAVDLTGKFLSESREVRIVTNLCVYWDRIYLSEDTAPPDAVLTPLDPAVADLRFRGFSRPVIDPERRQPEAFEYHDVKPLSMWNQTPGFYTRYGSVRELLTRADDRLVVMGSGDEVRLLFDAKALPALKTGWRRDFLLMFDGWAKDGDANTAFSQTVEPLPFHAMSAYPYGERERFPEVDTAREYNTRPALRLIRSLVSRDPALARDRSPSADRAGHRP